MMIAESSEEEIPPKVPQPGIVPYPPQPEVKPGLIPEVEPQKHSEIPDRGQDPECSPDSSPDASPQTPQTPETQPLHDLSSDRGV
jgi:hypothetical protein